MTVFGTKPWPANQVLECLTMLRAMRSDNPGSDLQAFIVAGCDPDETNTVLQQKLSGMAQQLRLSSDAPQWDRKAK